MKKTFFPLLLGSIGVIAIFILGSDFSALIQTKENEQTLEQLRIQKEKILAKKIETSQLQTKMNQLILLNKSEAGFTLAKLCETSEVFLAKIQLGKSTAKITQNTFEVSMDLMSDYSALLTFIDNLTQLPWKIDWQTLNITLGNSKKTPVTSLYPLQIKVKLAILHQYVPLTTTAKPNKSPVNIGYSPFVRRRCAGKLIENQHVIDLVVIGEKQNILRIPKPVLNYPDD